MSADPTRGNGVDVEQLVSDLIVEPILAAGLRYVGQNSSHHETHWTFQRPDGRRVRISVEES